METKDGKQKIPTWAAVFFLCFAIFFMVSSILFVFRKPILRRLDNDRIIKEAIALSLLEQEHPINSITVPDSELKNITNLQELTNKQFEEHFSHLKKWWQLTRSDYKKIKELYISDSNVYDISLLSKLKNLEKLQFYNVKVSNLEPITNLKNLKELRLIAMPVNNIEPLRNLTKLEEIRLYNVNVENLDVLFNLKNLKHLQLSIPVSREQKEELQKALPDLKID
jgi:hypothetical protein